MKLLFAVLETESFAKNQNVLNKNVFFLKNKGTKICNLKLQNWSWKSVTDSKIEGLIKFTCDKTCGKDIPFVWLHSNYLN